MSAQKTRGNAESAEPRKVGRPFPKGNPGRPKGAVNKTTRAVKEFLAELCDDPDVQAAVKARIVDGQIKGFFDAVQQIHGKPKESHDVKLDAGQALMQWFMAAASRASQK